MIDYTKIMTECYVDTMVINLLMGFSDTKGVNHKHGCNEVCQLMIGTDGFYLGIIDNDKRQHSYTKEFIQLSDNYHISLCKHQNRPQYLIKIHPAMDGFLLAIAGRYGINPEEYNLPPNLGEFKILTKNMNVKANDNLRRFIKSLRHSEEMNYLQSIIKAILSNPYSPDLP
ncbi:MAG: hypothetical protein LIP03_05030 [Bacteroidales bacterium]|nr:hypothetical protein [Bacteroidales bacterium]